MVGIASKEKTKPKPNNKALLFSLTVSAGLIKNTISAYELCMGKKEQKADKEKAGLFSTRPKQQAVTPSTLAGCRLS